MRLAAFPLVIVMTFGFAWAQTVENLSTAQRTELMVFGIRAGLRLHVGPGDIKNLPSGKDLEVMVATGLNGKGLLCAELHEIRALRLPGKYEARCIAYRGRSGKKVYIIDALKGIAFEE